MKNNVTISKKMAETIVQICYDVEGFSKLYNQNHPKSAQNIFNAVEKVKNGLKCLLNAQDPTELKNKATDYLKAIHFALEFYQNSTFSVEHKDEVIAQLSNLQKHVNNLIKELPNH